MYEGLKSNPNTVTKVLVGLSLSKNQDSGLSTGTPSKKIVAPNLPDASTQLPSLNTKNLNPPSLISSTRYISPSQRINLDDNTVSIQEKITTAYR